MYENKLKPCPFCGGQAHIAQYLAEFVRNTSIVVLKATMHTA